MEEIWKEIEGFEGKYEISNLGRIRTVKNIQHFWSRASGEWKLEERIQETNKIRVCFKNNKGYMRIALKNKDKVKDYLVHRLVAKTFIPNPENKRFVNHKNGNKEDNRVENLEWCTQKENMQHAVKNGLSKGRRKVGK